MFSARYVEKDHVIHAPLSDFFLEAFATPALSRFAGSGLFWAWPLTVTYESLAGERYSEEYMLTLSSGDVQSVLGAPVGQRDGVPNWTELTMRIAVSVMEITADPPLRSQLAGFAMRLFRYSLKPLENRRAIIRRSVHERILNRGRKYPRFKVGDRVLFKPHADWSLIDEDKPFQAAELEDIDMSQLTPVDPEDKKKDA